MLCYSGKDEFLTKLNLSQVAAEVANEMRGKSWDDRFKWVHSIKEEGNKLFKQEKYDDAIDIYMKGLCGMDFSQYDVKTKEEQKDKDMRVNRELKAPILNNIALCLNKQGKY